MTAKKKNKPPDADELLALAAPFPRPVDMINVYPSQYKRLRTLGLKPVAFPNTGRRIITDDIAVAIAKGHKTRASLLDADVTVYNYLWRRKDLHDKAYGHMPPPLRRYTDQEIWEAAGPYDTMEEFKCGDHRRYAASRGAAGLYDAIAATKASPKRIHTREKCAEAVKGFTYLNEFKDAMPLVLDAIYTKRWHDLLDGLERVAPDRTNEELAVIAKQFKHRVDFMRAASGPHAVASNRGILDDICEHMDPAPNSSDDDAVYLWKSHRLDHHKIGRTSWRLGMTRINAGGWAISDTPEVIRLVNVGRGARRLEKKLLKLGVDPKWSGFDGASEFRKLSDADLDEATRLIDAAQKKPPVTSG